MDAIEAMQTCRAMRYLSSEPVPEELIRRVIHAATCASSPGNSQGWDFVVVTDARLREALAAAMAKTLKPLVPEVSAPGGDRSRRLMLAGVHNLLDSLHRVPVLVLVCGRAVYPPAEPADVWIPPAVYPAAQNLIVAARSLGLGTAVTTFHGPAEKRVRDLLHLPDDVRIALTIPMGWPERKFGPVQRKPLDEVIHWNGW
jgi:nitroreductase